MCVVCALRGFVLTVCRCNSALGTARLLPRGEAREPSIGGRRSCSLGLTSGTPVGGRLAPVGSCSR